MNRLLFIACTAAALLGCPKRTTTNVSGTDDERMDQYSAQLEELRTRVQAREVSCSEWRELAGKICDIRANVCEIANRHVDRADMQQKCIAAQEDCARFNDSASSCKG